MKKRSADIIDFTIVYNKYKSQLYNYALRMTSNVTICEDIVQNVFLKFYENMDNLRDRERAGYWLFTTARNEIYEHYRSKKVKSDRFNTTDVYESDFESEFSVSSEAEKKDLRELILEELDNMPDEQREVFILKEYGEFSYREISAMLKIDEKLVKGRLYKVRQKLIKRISKLI